MCFQNPACILYLEHISAHVCHILSVQQLYMARAFHTGKHRLRGSNGSEPLPELQESSIHEFKGEDLSLLCQTQGGERTDGPTSISITLPKLQGPLLSGVEVLLSVLFRLESVTGCSTRILFQFALQSLVIKLRKSF